MTWLGNGGDTLVAAYGPHQLRVRGDPALGCRLPASAATEASYYTLISHAHLHFTPQLSHFVPILIGRRIRQTSDGGLELSAQGSSETKYPEPGHFDERRVPNRVNNE